MDKTIEKINKVALFFIIYSIVFITFFSTLSYTLPFVLAVIFSLLLQAPTKYLIRKFKLGEATASLLTTFLFFTIIITLLFLMITLLASEINQLTKNISIYAASRTDDFYNLFDKLHKYYNNLDPTIVTSLKNSLASSITSLTKSTANIGVIVVGGLMRLVSSIPYVLMVIIFTLIATYFFTKDFTKSNNRLINSVFSQDANRIAYIYSESKRMLLGYMRSYLFIIFITFVITFIGFAAVGVNYSLVLSLLCAVLDLLPVLGIAMIYIPVAILFLINGEIAKCVVILALYALVSVVRQVVEPRIVSSSLGIHPVAVLAAIFIGLKINGISGMFFFMFLVVFYNIFKKVDLL
jgi:sporulation integral membrane protein YtvI